MLDHASGSLRRRHFHGTKVDGRALSGKPADRIGRDGCFPLARGWEIRGSADTIAAAALGAIEGFVGKFDEGGCVAAQLRQQGCAANGNAHVAGRVVWMRQPAGAQILADVLGNQHGAFKLRDRKDDRKLLAAETGHHVAGAHRARLRAGGRRL